MGTQASLRDSEFFGLPLSKEEKRKESLSFTGCERGVQKFKACDYYDALNYFFNVTFKIH